MAIKGTYRRGVVIFKGSRKVRDWASGSARAFLDQARELVDVDGIREVSLSHVGGDLAELTQDPSFQSLERVTLLGPLNDQDAARIGKTALSRLHTLVMEDSELTAAGVRALLAGGLPAQLVRLDLSGNPLGDEGFAALGSVPLPRLEGLRVHGCQIHEDGAVAFAAAATVPKLRELDLGGEYFTVFQGGGNALGPVGARALAAAPFLRQLETFVLRGNDIQNEGALALAGVPLAARYVDLSFNTIGATGAAALAGAPWPALRRLGICQGNPLIHGADADVYQLAELPRALTCEEVLTHYRFPRRLKDLY